MARFQSRLVKLLLLLAAAALHAAHAGRDYYDLLGVPRDAPTSVIKKSYRQLAKMYHPDKHPGNKKYEKKFKAISTAYEVLSDDEQRRRYDQFGEEGLQNGGGGGAGHAGFHGFGGGHQFHRASFGGGFADFDANMFADMFGGAFGGGGGGGGGGFAFSGNSRRQRYRQQPPPQRRICFQNKVCENNRCFSVKECTS